MNKKVSELEKELKESQEVMYESSKKGKSHAKIIILSSLAAMLAVLFIFSLLWFNVGGVKDRLPEMAKDVPLLRIRLTTDQEFINVREDLAKKEAELKKVTATMEELIKDLESAEKDVEKKDEQIAEMEEMIASLTGEAIEGGTREKSVEVFEKMEAKEAARILGSYDDILEVADIMSRMKSDKVALIMKSLPEDKAVSIMKELNKRRS